MPIESWQCEKYDYIETFLGCEKPRPDEGVLRREHGEKQTEVAKERDRETETKKCQPWEGQSGPYVSAAPAVTMWSDTLFKQAYQKADSKNHK